MEDPKIVGFNDCLNKQYQNLIYSELAASLFQMAEDSTDYVCGTLGEQGKEADKTAFLLLTGYLEGKKYKMLVKEKDLVRGIISSRRKELSAKVSAANPSASTTTQPPRPTQPPKTTGAEEKPKKKKFSLAKLFKRKNAKAGKAPVMKK